MIVTVTLNPALDQTIEIKGLIEGGLNVVCKTEKDPGGKGINVSKVLKSMGVESIALGFLGGDTGKNLEKMLSIYDLNHRFTGISGETRTNLKVIDTISGITTEFNQKGPMVFSDELHQLEQTLDDTLSVGDWVVISGSVPEGIGNDIYPRLIQAVKSKGAKVFFDADGIHFKNGVKMKPNAIKPNIKELEDYFEKSLETTSLRIAAANALLAEGIEHVFVTLGEDGALYKSKAHAFLLKPLKVNAHSAVGAGDAFVAAAVYGLSQEMPIETVLKSCVATSAGAVMTEGTKPMDQDWVENQMRFVTIESL